MNLPEVLEEQIKTNLCSLCLTNSSHLTLPVGLHHLVLALTKELYKNTINPCCIESLWQAEAPIQKPVAVAQSPSHSVHPAQGESSQCSDLSGHKGPLPPLQASQRVPSVQGPELPLLPYSFLPSDPGQWNIEDVYEFISSLPGESWRVALSPHH